MKRLMTLTVLIVIGMYLALPGSVIAQERQVGAADQIFAMKAAAGDLTEVQLGKLAAERAASPQVKQLSQRLVEDHTKSSQELMKIAKEKGITLPKQLEGTHEEVVQLFSKLEGERFDREYLSYQLMHHEGATAEFEVQAKEGQDPDLRAFAEKELPTLREHRQQVRQLAAQQPAGGMGKGSPERPKR